MKRGRQESLSDKIHRHRSLILVLSVPLLLVSFVLFLMPRVPSDSAASDLLRSRRGANSHLRFLPDKSTKNYVVIFDAGSSGSRVHVFRFDHKLDLLPIGKDLELFLQKKPGLSYYANDPLGAANSLNSLLLDAENAIPSSLHVTTPVKVGATAGLRALEGDASDRILEASKQVKNFTTSLGRKSLRTMIFSRGNNLAAMIGNSVRWLCIICYMVEDIPVTCFIWFKRVEIYAVHELYHLAAIFAATNTRTQRQQQGRRHRSGSSEPLVKWCTIGSCMSASLLLLSF